MTEIIEEIIKRVKDNNLPLEDSEFTIDGRVYITKEIEGDWKCCYFGVNFDTFKRNVVCEVFEGDMSLNMFIVQYQEKAVYPKNVSREYRYGECIAVKRQTEEFVIDGWVKA